MKRINIILLMTLVTLITACSMFNDLPQPHNSEGVAQVRVSINTNARTIFPDFDWVFSKYALSVTPAPGNTQNAPSPVEFSGDVDLMIIEIPLGNWILNVTGYIKVAGTDYAAAKGSLTLDVDGSKWVAVALNLPESGGTGTFALTATYPSGGTARVKLEPWPLGSGSALINDVTVVSGTPLSQSVPSGIYFLTIAATKDGNTLTRNEIVHVYQRLISNANYVFTKLDFGENNLQLSGTIKVLIDGQQPETANIRVNYIWPEATVNFTDSDGSGEWLLELSDLRGASTLDFFITVAGLFEKESVTISVPSDDKTDIDLGTVNFVTTRINPDDWVTGTIPEGEYSAEDWYSMEVIADTSYYFWINNSQEGDGTKTANAYADARSSDGENLFQGANKVWYMPREFTATTSGIIYLRVQSYGSGDDQDRPYTYEFLYSTDSTHVDAIAPIANTLAVNTWKEGEILEGATHWYSIEVTADTRYSFWLNNLSYGDGTKTAEVSLIVYKGGNDSSYTSYSWNDPSSFVAEKNGTVYVGVVSYWSTGTYALAYSTNSKWRVETVAMSLDINTWIEGTFIANTHEPADWYSFNVTSGETYYFWMNNGYDGDGTKTANSYISAYYSDEIHPIIDASTYWAWYLPMSFTATKDGKVYLKAQSSNVDLDASETTYAILYSTNGDFINNTNTIPATELSAGTWVVGYLPAGVNSTSHWYSIAEGETGYIWMNSVYDGDGTKTAGADIEIMYGDGEYIPSGGNNLWTNPVRFTGKAGVKVFLRVLALRGDWEDTEEKSYAIAYSTSETRP